MNSLELRIPPVALVVITGVAMWLLASAVPGLGFPLPASSWLAILFTASGAAIAILGVIEFNRAGTTVDPMHPQSSSELVTGGIYRLSRNPMYLGFLLTLVGWACYLSHLLAFALLPGFVLYMNRFQIAPEERQMRELFGTGFESYATGTRRWI